MPEQFPLDGGWALFRCFRAAVERVGGVNLTSLTSLGSGGRYGYYQWGPGPRAAECPHGHSAEPLQAPDWDSDRPDRLPVVACSCGFWGFKTIGEMFYQEGYDNDLVYALMEQWGNFVEHEIGMRTEYAEIVAFIEPVRPEHLKNFPREGLRQSFPGIPIVKLTKLSDVVEERGLTMLKRTPAPPILQWLATSGKLVWGRGTLQPGEEWGTRLPVAATHPAESISVATHLLRKARFRVGSGQAYTFWQHDDGPVSKREDFKEFYRAIQKWGAHELAIHREH